MSYEVQWLHKIRYCQFCEFCLYASNAYLSFWIHSDLSLDFASISYLSYLMMHKKCSTKFIIAIICLCPTHYLLEIHVLSLSISMYIYFYYLLLFCPHSLSLFILSFLTLCLKIPIWRYFDKLSFNHWRSLTEKKKSKDFWKYATSIFSILMHFYLSLSLSLQKNQGKHRNIDTKQIVSQKRRKMPERCAFFFFLMCSVFNAQG